MSKRSFLLPAMMSAGVALGVLLTGWLVSGPAAHAQPQSAPQVNGGLKIGLVNLMQCFDGANYEKFRAAAAESKKIRADIDDRIQAIEKEMKDLEEQIKGLQRGSALLQEKVRKYKMKEMEYKLEYEMGKVKVRTEESRLMLDVYNEIRRVIDIYAKDNKFDIVMRVEEPQFEDTPSASTAEQINQRVVLYCAEPLDITKDLLKLLNAEYAKNKVVGAPPADGNVCPTCQIKTTEAKCPKCGQEISKGSPAPEPGVCPDCKIKSTEAKCPKCGKDIPK